MLIFSIFLTPYQTLADRAVTYAIQAVPQIASIPPSCSFPPHPLRRQMRQFRSKLSRKKKAGNLLTWVRLHNVQHSPACIAPQILHQHSLAIEGEGLSAPPIILFRLVPQAVGFQLSFHPVFYTAGQSPAFHSVTQETLLQVQHSTCFLALFLYILVTVFQYQEHLVAIWRICNKP